MGTRHGVRIFCIIMSAHACGRYSYMYLLGMYYVCNAYVLSVCRHTPRYRYANVLAIGYDAIRYMVKHPDAH